LFPRIIEIAPMSELLFHGNALEQIHAVIVETSRHRSLTRLEIRIRCMTAPRPWRDAGCSQSTYYRRKKRSRLAAEAMAEAA
jgi:hypothetical protein